MKLVEPVKKEPVMRISKDQIPAKINVPGAVARVATDFGDATGFGKMGGDYFSLGAGTDIAPLLKGLKDDACHAMARSTSAKRTTSSTGRPATACGRSKTPRSSCSARSASTPTLWTTC